MADQPQNDCHRVGRWCLIKPVAAIGGRRDDGGGSAGVGGGSAPEGPNGFEAPQGPLAGRDLHDRRAASQVGDSRAGPAGRPAAAPPGPAEALWPGGGRGPDPALGVERSALRQALGAPAARSPQPSIPPSFAVRCPGSGRTALCGVAVAPQSPIKSLRAALSSDRRGDASRPRPAMRQPLNDRVTPAGCSGP